jgi:phage head maturation protease
VRSLKTKGFENSKDALILFSHDDDPTLWKGAAQEVYEVINKVAEPKGLRFRVEIQNPYKTYCDMATAIVHDTEIHRKESWEAAEMGTGGIQVVGGIFPV